MEQPLPESWKSKSSALTLAHGAVSRRVKVIGYMVMIFLSCAVLEVAAYGYLRLFEGYDGTHLMNYEFDDYKNIRPTPYYHNTKGIYHNGEGFRRSEETPLAKEEGSYRIFIMGGSTAYGLGSLSKYGQEKYSVIRNDETIDHYLEKFLEGRTPYKKVEVINAAITSQMSHHHLIYLNQTILKYHPDMIIFIDGFNDYYPYTKGFDQFRDYAYRERVHQYMAEPSISAWLGYTGWWLFRKSHFVHVAGKTLLPIWQWVKSIGHRRARMNVDVALANLRKNARNNFLKMVERNSLILKNEGVVAVFTVQPEIEFKQSKMFTKMEQDILQEMNTHWAINYSEFKNRARPMVLEWLRQVTGRTGSFLIDLTDPFGGLDEDAYTDYCHLTPAGNKRLAEYLGERVLPLIHPNPQSGALSRRAQKNDAGNGHVRRG
jgi:lysophospholipase L1-like esterase